MFGHADCNNFYATCQTVFRPDLRGRPVIVLSNNDGCVIARSAEAKDLGIEMGVPYFMIEDKIKEHGIVVFSSNYELYDNMSRRVLSILSMFASRVEYYSIDECFLDFTGMELHDMQQYCEMIRKTVLEWTGITISIGVAKTKTLAKTANKLAKKLPCGVRVLTDSKGITETLGKYPVADLWGIGRKYADFLHDHGINTALQFREADPILIRKKLHVWGDRMQAELKGIPCMEMAAAETRKNICTSRSFGKMVTDYEELRESVAAFAANCSRKLRMQKTVCNEVTVFIQSNPFRHDLPQYNGSRTIKLEVASNDIFTIEQAALKGLKMLYRLGYHYKKSGIIVGKIVPENAIQQSLFTPKQRPEMNQLMKAIDRINSRFGKSTVRTAIEGYFQEWQMQRNLLSPCYTTQWNDLPAAIA